MHVTCVAAAREVAMFCKDALHRATVEAKPFKLVLEHV